MQPWMGPWEHHTPPGAGSTNRTHFFPNWTTPAGRVETPYFLLCGAVVGNQRLSPWIKDDIRGAVSHDVSVALGRVCVLVGAWRYRSK